MGLGTRYINAGLCSDLVDLAQQVTTAIDDIGDAGAAGLTAGCGIILVDGVIAARVDGVTIGCVDGVLVAIGGGADYFAGVALSLSSPGNVFDVQVDGVTIGVNGSNQLEVLVEGVAYLPGEALDLSGNTFNVKTDGITIAVNGSNELEVMTVPPAISQGDGIRLGSPTPDIEISVNLVLANPCLEFSGGKLQLKVDPTGGLERSADGVKEKWPYRIVKGQATTNYHAGTGDVIIDHVTSAVGEEVTSDDADTITCKTQQNIWLDNNEEVYAIYLEDPNIDNGHNWSVCTALNFSALLKGLDGFDKDKHMRLHWDPSSPGKLKWVKSSARIVGTATADVAEDDPTFTLTVTKTLDGVPPATSTVTVNNGHGWEIGSGGLVRAERDPDTGEWEAYQVSCP